ncbi:MAG TPA: hypothetical protein PK636_03145 [bacterium]|nr:hypothetical protein [bacterium]HPJ71661.1 hypothetical protein [bacterium]
MSGKILASILILSLAGPVTAPGQEWELSTALGEGTITGVGGNETGEVWAVPSGQSRQGKVFYYNGSAWTLQTSVFSSHTGEFRGMFVYPEGEDVWAVGNYNTFPAQGTIFHYNGTSWALQTVLIGGSHQYLYSAYSPDSYHVWVGGSDGNIYASGDEGATWQLQTSLGSGVWVRGMAGSSFHDAWAVAGVVSGNPPTWILHWDGVAWEVETTVQICLYDVASGGEEAAAASGYAGTILQYDGNEWSLFTDIGNPTVSSVAVGLQNDKVWAGSSNGDILFYNGVHWAVQTHIVGSIDISAIRTAGTGEIWAGAQNGSVYRLRVRPPQRWIYDYNGDGTSDIALFRSGAGLWLVRGLTRVYFGQSADTAAPGDYNGDGTTDIAVFRPASSLWAIRNWSRVYFGNSGDTPIPADFSGDGTADCAIFRNSSRLWAVRGLTRIYYGTAGDYPVPADYTADGSTNVAIFRPANGLWKARAYSYVYFGQAGDIPVPAAYDGGGGMPGIFRPSTGLWALLNGPRIYYGQNADTPLPAFYEGGGSAGIGIFRESVGLWAIRHQTRVYFGQTGDTPVVK